MIYNPTTFEAQKQQEFFTHSCLSCHQKIVSRRRDNQWFCNQQCERDYDELGPLEYPCIDFDAEDNM